MRQVLAVRRVDPILCGLVVVGLIGVGFGLSPAALTSQLGAYWLLMAVTIACFTAASGRVATMQPPGAEGAGGRRMWRAMFICGGIALAGTAWQVGVVLRDPGGPDAILGDTICLVAMAVSLVVAVGGMLLFPVGELTADARVRMRLDVLTVLAGAATVGMWHVSLPDGSFGVGWVLHLVAILLVAPGLFLVLIFAVVKIVLSGHPPAGRVSGLLIAAAVLLLTGVQSAPESAWVSGGPTTSWLLGGSLVGMVLSAIGARAEERRIRANPYARRPAHRPYSMLPYVAMAATWVQTAVILAGDGLDWHAWLVGGGALLTTALVVGRQITAFRQIAELLAERDALAARLTDLAFHDGLTGLPNRALFMSRLAEGLSAGPVTVFLIDLDGFKPVNDEFGHATGDQLLVEAGRRLRAVVRDGDTVARLGGDEFAVLAPGVDFDRRDELSAALHDVVRIGDADVPLCASVGAAHGRSGADRLLHEADMAMYAEKRQRRTALTP